MFKYGVKIGTVDTQYISDIRQYLSDGTCDYVELFILPGSSGEYIAPWRELSGQAKVPFVIHAPHSMKGLNLAQNVLFENNRRMAEEAIRFADVLNADSIIFHSGIAGDEKETVSQLKKIYDPRFLIENTPYHTINDDRICNGYSPEQIRFIIEKAKVGFCLDIGHAYCAANALNKERMEYVRQFMSLKPRMFHLSDGDSYGVRDRHDHFGEGDYDIKNILAAIPQGSRITVETDKNYPDRLADFAADIAFLKKAEK